MVNRNTFSMNIGYGCGCGCGETVLCGVKSVTAEFLMEMRAEGGENNSG
jgi:hypothetical protein